MIADPAVLKGRRFGNVVLAASRAPLPVDDVRRSAARAAFPRTVTARVSAATTGRSPTPTRRGRLRRRTRGGASVAEARWPTGRAGGRPPAHLAPQPRSRRVLRRGGRRPTTAPGRGTRDGADRRSRLARRHARARRRVRHRQGRRRRSPPPGCRCSGWRSTPRWPRSPVRTASRSRSARSRTGIRRGGRSTCSPAGRRGTGSTPRGGAARLSRCCAGSARWRCSGTCTPSPPTRSPALDEVYARLAPALASRTRGIDERSRRTGRAGTMGRAVTDLEAAGFADVRTREFPWEQVYRRDAVARAAVDLQRPPPAARRPAAALCWLRSARQWTRRAGRSRCTTGLTFCWPRSPEVWV